jgi:hypothetical protein
MVPPRRARTTDSRQDLPIAPNLLNRDFTAAPNQIWLADITYSVHAVQHLDGHAEETSRFPLVDADLHQPERARMAQLVRHYAGEALVD